MRPQGGDSFRVKLLTDAPHAHYRGRAHHETVVRSRLARGWERFLSCCYKSSGFDVPRVGCHNEADEADDEAQVAHSPSQGYFKFWGTESFPKRVTTVCASERRVSARRRLSSAWQFVCATWPHNAATHRGVTSRTKQCAHKAVRHSPSQGHFIILGTETCSQNGHHSLRSRAERERAPTPKICAAILMAASLQKFWATCFGREGGDIWQYVREGYLPTIFASVVQIGLQKFWATCFGGEDGDIWQYVREGLFASVAQISLQKFWATCFGREGGDIWQYVREGFSHTIFASVAQIGLQKFWATCFGREDGDIWKYVREGHLPTIFTSVAQIDLQKFWATCFGSEDGNIYQYVREGCLPTILASVAHVCLQRFWATCFGRDCGDMWQDVRDGFSRTIS